MIDIAHENAWKDEQKKIKLFETQLEVAKDIAMFEQEQQRLFMQAQAAQAQQDGVGYAPTHYQGDPRMASSVQSSAAASSYVDLQVTVRCIDRHAHISCP